MSVKKMEDIMTERKEILTKIVELQSDKDFDKKQLKKYENMLNENYLKDRVLNEKRFSKMEMEEYLLKTLTKK